MSQPNVIYIYSSESSFIQKDIAFLKEKYSVQTQFYNWTNKIWVPLFLVRQLSSLLFRSNSETVYIIMFAGFWSVIPVLLASLFGRRSFIIVGGTDCVSFPELNYGAIRKPMQKNTIRYSLNNCTTILPVAGQLVESDYTYVDYREKKQGYLSFFPEIQTPVKVIYNGFDVPSADGDSKRTKSSFITVAQIDNEVTYQLKGIDLIVEPAKINPELNFTVVGISDTLVERLELNKILNLTCYSFLKHEELGSLYKKHQFYLCLSISEGFPNALCEGMSHGCVPIGSNVSSIPFIIDETGFILQKRDPEMLNELLNKVISSPPNQLKLMGESARNRIGTEFNLERRKKAFYELIG